MSNRCADLQILDPHLAEPYQGLGTGTTFHCIQYDIFNPGGPRKKEGPSPEHG
jgi:hypothetical protein